mgnify:CR=1 FL=1
MADELNPDEIILEIITEYKLATQQTRVFMEFIQTEAKKAQLSWATIADGLAERLPGMKKEISAALKLLEGAKRNTEEWANQAERGARAFEKAKFAQAQSKVSSLFTNEDYLTNIGDAATAERTRFATAAQAASTANSNLANSTNKANQAIGATSTATKSATSGLFSLRNVARTALGTFEAMAIFFLTQLVGQAIKKTIDSISQLEQSLIKLAIAEKAISKAGVDITPQQLSSIIKDVAAAYDTVSKIDASKMVSNLAVLTKDLQLTAKEYRDLAMAIPLVAQQAGVSIDSATEQVINGLTKSGRGWADLGITVDAEIIKQKAVAEGLVATRAEYEALSAEQKQNVEVQALISILLENTNANLEEQSNYLNTIEGQTKSANAQWEDLLATLGRIARPTIIIFLKEANTALSTLNDWLDSNEQQWNQWSASVAAASIIAGGAVKLMYQIIGGRTVNPLQEMYKILAEAGNAYREALGLAKGLDDIGQDTPTGDTEPQGSLEQDQEDLQKALEKMNDEILEAQLKLAQDMEDAQIDLGRKLVDITTEYAKKRADAERDYSSKVADINSSYRNRIAEIASQQAEANQKARNDELEREAKFQEQMRQLKERFLMDLEDALHARDARQVLRLIKQYNLDKAQAEREHALDQENAQREQEERNSKFARERADAERDRKAKLADAQRDYAEKLAKLKADEEAERAAAELAYQRKMQDLEREMQNKLEIVAANLIAEFNLTKEGLDAILALYQRYYSEIASIYAAMNAMLMGQGNLSGASAKKNSGTLSTKSSGIGGGQRFAEGGSMIANKPTTVTFGDNNGEFELATFTPLQHAGRDMNKAFSSLSGGQSDGMGGMLELSLLLSPDLEAKITKNTLDTVGQVITKVRRSKR